MAYDHTEVFVIYSSGTLVDEYIAYGYGVRKFNYDIDLFRKVFGSIFVFLWFVFFI